MWYESTRQRFVVDIRSARCSEVLENNWTSLCINDWVEEPRYDFRDPTMTAAADDAGAALIAALAETPAFVRLHDIRFLGSLDYALVDRPNGTRGQARFTRAQHSFGVAALASTYTHAVGLSEKERLIALAAAMLHDVGHAPFSHTLEPLFVEVFGVNHHSASESVILGRVPVGAEVPSVLKRFGIDPDDVVAVLNGEDSRFSGFYSGPINFDTIEGILRSSQYLKMQDLGLSPERVLLAAIHRSSESHQRTVDNFWRCKDEMYNVVIRSAPGVLCDLIFLEVAKSSLMRLSAGDFLSTERRIFEKVPELRAILSRTYSEAALRDRLPPEVAYEERRFVVDPEGDFFDRQDRRRYRQTKAMRTLAL